MKNIGIFLLIQFAISSCNFDSNKEIKNYQLGKQLFNDNCAICHSTNETTLVGPGLGEVFYENDQKYIVNFLHNFDLLLKEDSAVIKLYNDYNKINHPIFDSLSEVDISAVIEFVNYEYEKEKARVVDSIQVTSK